MTWAIKVDYEKKYREVSKKLKEVRQENEHLKTKAAVMEMTNQYLRDEIGLLLREIAAKVSPQRYDPYYGRGMLGALHSGISWKPEAKSESKYPLFSYPISYDTPDVDAAIKLYRFSGPMGLPPTSSETKKEGG